MNVSRVIGQRNEPRAEPPFSSFSMFHDFQLSRSDEDLAPNFPQAEIRGKLLSQMMVVRLRNQNLMWCDLKQRFSLWDGNNKIPIACSLGIELSATGFNIHLMSTTTPSIAD
jgi:hypothetical protein